MIYKLKNNTSETTMEEKFNKVKGRPYATLTTMQVFNSTTGILSEKSPAFNCIGLISYLFDVKASFSVKEFTKYTEFYEIGKNQLQKNDIIRWCGSNDDGENNHVQVWRDNNTTWESCYGKGVIERKPYDIYEKWYKAEYPNYKITYFRKR